MNQSKLKIKGIFLDLDGTIVDSTEAYIEAAIIAFKAMEEIPPKDQILLEIPRRIEQRLSIDDLIYGKSREFMKSYFKAYYSITETKTKLIPNVSETLYTLSRKAKIALVTMRQTPNQVIYKELDCFGIAQYFKYIVTGSETSKPKPSPEALVRCAEAFNIEMCDCIIVGDSVNDVRAGKAAGTKTVAVLSGLYEYKELVNEDPDLIIPDINTLPNFIK